MAGDAPERSEPTRRRRRPASRVLALTAETGVTEGGAFGTDSTAAMLALSQATRRIIDALPGDIRRATDLEAALLIDRKLAWQVFRVSAARGAGDAARDVPTRVRFERFLAAASAAGASAARVVAARRAYVAVGLAVERHAAGDGQLFASMAGGTGKQLRSQTSDRRELHRAHVRTMGLRADTYTAVRILHPSADGTAIDMASLHGLFGLARLRPGVPLSLVGRRNSGDFKRPGGEPEPLDREAFERGGVEVMAAFSSPAAAALRAYKSDDGFQRVEVTDPAIGLTASIDHVLGDVLRGIGPGDFAGQEINFNLRVRARWPVERLVIEALVPRSLWPGVAPTPGMFWDYLGGDAVWQCRDADRLPLPEKIEIVGTGTTPAPLAGVPQHAGMIASALATLGWSATTFSTFRLTVNYPVLASVVLMRFAGKVTAATPIV